MGNLKLGILIASIILLTSLGTAAKYLWDKNTILTQQNIAYEVALDKSSNNLKEMANLLTKQQEVNREKDAVLLKLREHANRVERVAVRKPRSYERLVNNDHKAFWRGLTDETKQPE